MRTSPSTREKRELGSLRFRRNRDATGRFLVEGVRVVEDLIASGFVIHWVLVSSSLEDGERGARLTHELEARKVPVRQVDDREFARLADTAHPQGILAVAESPVRTLDDLEGARVILVLDGVQDPGNFGTLVRSGEALGAGGVIALPGTVDPWNPKAVRSAVGSSFRQPLVTATWPESEAWLRSRGYAILAAAVGGEPVPSVDRAALVLGNEGAGISAEVLSGVDRTVGIELRGRAESLNVAAAAAILLHQLCR
jgi:RNA methyltransferase, TrmH family